MPPLSTVSSKVKREEEAAVKGQGRREARRGRRLPDRHLDAGRPTFIRTRTTRPVTPRTLHTRPALSPPPTAHGPATHTRGAPPKKWRSGSSAAVAHTAPLRRGQGGKEARSLDSGGWVPRCVCVCVCMLLLCCIYSTQDTAAHGICTQSNGAIEREPEDTRVEREG